MTLSMASSANSALLDDYLSSCSHEEQTVGAVGGPMERERAPYSGIPGGKYQTSSFIFNRHFKIF